MHFLNISLYFYLTNYKAYFTIYESRSKSWTPRTSGSDCLDEKTFPVPARFMWHLKCLYCIVSWSRLVGIQINWLIDQLLSLWKLTLWSLNDLILKLNRPNVGLAGFMTYPKNYYYYLPQFYSFPSYESYGQNCQRIRKWPHWRRMRKIEMMKRILTRSFKRFWTQNTHFFTECLNPWWKVSKNAPKYAQIVRASIILVIVYGIWDLKELFMHQDEFRPETIGWWIVMLIDILIDSMRGFFIASVYCFR